MSATPTVNPAPTPDADDGEDEPMSPMRRLAWFAGITFAVASFGLWIYAIFFYDPGLLVDELADRTFPIAAEEVCAEAIAQLDQLPRAESTKEAADRADVIDNANVILAAMVVDLREIAPSEPPKAAEAVDEWLDDWDTSLEDRQRYADVLHLDPEAQYLETKKGEKQVSRAIDGYAQVNRMNSCETPGDVG